MAADEYLRQILAREAVDTSMTSPVRQAQWVLQPALNEWAGTYLADVSASGSFAKGTANASGTDIDLFLSLKSVTPATLKEIYNTLYSKMENIGYRPKRQNVSINVRVNAYDVDLVPAKRQDTYSQDHSLYRRKADTWTQTNVSKHIALVSSSRRTEEIRVLKLWRNQKGLDFLSFYLELTAIAALNGRPYGALADNVWKVFQFLRDSFLTARVVDPANSNNIISDDLTVDEKRLVRSSAMHALNAKNWTEIVI
jgi:hypothetical protein